VSDTTHQINLALRTAAGHARAANDALAAAEGTYEMKMKSAGASVWEAWSLAVRAQPEFAGRKIDDKALVRLYESTKARPWWDKHLSTVKFQGKPVNREWAKRTLQWHTDPNAARVRRAKDAALSAANHKKRKEKVEASGRQRPQAGAPSTAAMREVATTFAAQDWAGWDFEHGDRPTAGDDIERLLERVRRAAQRVCSPVELAEAEAILRLAAEGLEAL
jgi:hypothetical protein